MQGRYYYPHFTGHRLRGWIDYHWPSGDQTGASSALRMGSADTLGDVPGISMVPNRWLKGKKSLWWGCARGKACQPQRWPGIDGCSLTSVFFPLILQGMCVVHNFKGTQGSPSKPKPEDPRGVPLMAFPRIESPLETLSAQV